MFCIGIRVGGGTSCFLCEIEKYFHIVANALDIGRHCVVHSFRRVFTFRIVVPAVQNRPSQRVDGANLGFEFQGSLRDGRTVVEFEACTHSIPFWKKNEPCLGYKFVVVASDIKSVGTTNFCMSCTCICIGKKRRISNINRNTFVLNG